MRVKVLLVVTIFGVEGEVCGRETPTEIREHRGSLRRPVADHIWDIALSWKEPDFDRVGPSVHCEIPATGLVERGAVGRAGRDGVGENDTTPCVEVDRRVAITIHGLSTTNF